MALRRIRRFLVEVLEGRQMLSGAGPVVHVLSTAHLAKGPVMPYTELTLSGHFTSGAPTTVTFASKGHATITATPVSVSKTTVVVAVPAFFDPETSQPVASIASVSVQQEIGGASKSTRVLKSLSVARLPLTGLMAGDVLGAVTVEAAAVTADAAGRFTQIGAALSGSKVFPSGITSRIVADLDEISLLIPQAQQLLVGLATGAVATVPLGTYQGQPATLDAGQLGVLDRIVAAGINDATGVKLQGVPLVESLENLVAVAASAGPAAVIDQAMNVVDVLGTATGSPVIPPGAVATGLALGSLSAVVAAAEAEAMVIQGALSPSSTLGPSDIAMVDRVLDDPALGQALQSLTSGLVPYSAAGQALVQAALLAEDLAAQIDPNVSGSAGSTFATGLKIVPLHGA